MEVNLPPKVRLAVYVLNGVLAPVSIYLRAKGYIGDLEMALIGAELTFAYGLAGLNTIKNAFGKDK